MKKQLLFAVPALSLCFGAAVAANTSATSYSEITDAATLKTCMEQETTATCSLGGDVKLTTNIVVKDQITLDLNGKTVGYDDSFTADNNNAMFAVLHGASLTINDSVGTGKVTAKGGSGKGLYAALQVTKKGEDDDTKPAVLTVNGGTFEGDYYVIVGSGNNKTGNRRQNTQITINGGKFKASAEGNAGIYHPQKGILTINGGNIEGETGIYMKSGTLNINGGTIIGNGAKADYVYDGSGFNPTGDAIVIDNCNYPGSTPSANISGGTIKSAKNQAVASYTGNGVEEEDAVVPAIKGGVFISAVEPENIPEGFEKIKTEEGWIVQPIFIAPEAEDVAEASESTTKAPNSGYMTGETNAVTSFIVAFMLAGSAIFTFAGIKFYNRKNS